MTDTSTENVPETVNIFLGSKDQKEKIMSTASAHEQYIIVQNDTLHVMNKVLTSENKELSSKVEEMEDYEDRADSRTNTMKGLLKNFHEIDKWRQGVSTIQATMLEDVNKDMMTFKQKARCHIRIFQAVLFCLVVVCFKFLGSGGSAWFEIPLSSFLIVFSLSAMIIAFHEFTLADLPCFKYPKPEVEIVKLNREIKKATTANDYIHEFLDQQ